MGRDSSRRDTGEMGHEERMVGFGRTFEKLAPPEFGDFYHGLTDGQRRVMNEAVFAAHARRGSSAKDLMASVAWLEEIGVLKAAFSDDLQLKSEKWNNDELMTIGDAVGKILPERFLPEHIQVNYELERNKEEAEHPVPGMQSLFHGTTDKNLLRILKTGFQKAEEHQRTQVGTGSFEKSLGLNGVFTTCGVVYETFDVRHTNNLDSVSVFVFPEDAINKPHNVVISVETSLGLVYEMGLNDRLSDIDDVMADELAKRDKVLRAALSTVVSLVNEYLVPPERLVASSVPEVCLDVDEMDDPDMLVVGEDAGWYFDEVDKFQPELAKTMSIVTLEQIRLALDSLSKQQVEDEPEFPPEVDIIEKFVYHVRVGNLDVSDWKYVPDAEGEE